MVAYEIKIQKHLVIRVGAKLLKLPYFFCAADCKETCLTYMPCIFIFPPKKEFERHSPWDQLKILSDVKMEIHK